jgi:uncharacterized protein YukE
MANINVTFQDLKTASGQIITGKGALEDKINELQRLVTDLVSSGFVTDQASGAFQESFTTFTQGATQAVGGAQGMADYLTKAADSLQSADTELANAIRG